MICETMIMDETHIVCIGRKDQIIISLAEQREDQGKEDNIYIDCTRMDIQKVLSFTDFLAKFRDIERTIYFGPHRRRENDAEH